jgi:hypothetical protein
MSRATAARIDNIEGQHALDAQAPIGVIRGPSTARAAGTPIQAMSEGRAPAVQVAMHTARVLNAPVAWMTGTITMMNIETLAHRASIIQGFLSIFPCSLQVNFGPPGPKFDPAVYHVAALRVLNRDVSVRLPFTEN